jgi:hypothetical protein
MSRRPVDRRLLLIGALCAAHPARAEAPPRLSRAQARYQDRPRGGISCVACSFFRKPRSCQVVEGDISPSGWCRLFDMVD